MRYYSESTGTTYIEGIHKVMPNDVVEISDELFDEVIANAPIDKVRGHKDGLPFLMDAPPPGIDQLRAAERVWRDLEIERIKWLRERHRDEVDMGRTASLAQDQFAELLVFIQLLRDWPESTEFPKQEKRPAAPSWIAAQIE